MNIRKKIRQHILAYGHFVDCGNPVRANGNTDGIVLIEGKS